MTSSWYCWHLCLFRHLESCDIFWKLLQCMSLQCSVIPCHSLRISQPKEWAHFLRISLKVRGFYGSGFAFRKIPLKSDGEGDASCSLPAFWFVYSSFQSLLYFFFLAQQVKKSDRRRSGVLGADLCGGGVVSPAQAEPAPACPAAFHLSTLCSEQPEAAAAAEGKEAETAPSSWCPSPPHCVALSALQCSSHTDISFHYDFTALPANWVEITSEVSAEVWRKWGHTYHCCCGGAFFFIGGCAVKTNEPLFLSLLLAIFYRLSDAICLGKHRQAGIFVALLQHLLIKGELKGFKADIFPPYLLACTISSNFMSSSLSRYLWFLSTGEDAESSWRNEGIFILPCCRRPNY